MMGASKDVSGAASAVSAGTQVAGEAISPRERRNRVICLAMMLKYYFFALRM